MERVRAQTEKALISDKEKRLQMEKVPDRESRRLKRHYREKTRQCIYVNIYIY